jgi:molybdopterin-guanine dinucleotide biosynthesis protein MobB
MRTAAVAIVAKSGTGKTTLLEKLIAELKRREYRVGVIKHDAHKFEIDHEGKDSWRLTKAGADTMMISSAAKFAVVKINETSVEPPVQDLLDQYFGEVDIILTEGFKMSGLPKIVVHRKERGEALLCRGEEYDDCLIAVASDETMDLDVPLFHINDACGICDFIELKFKLGNMRESHTN